MTTYGDDLRIGGCETKGLFESDSRREMLPIGFENEDFPLRRHRSLESRIHARRAHPQLRVHRIQPNKATLSIKQCDPRSAICCIG